MPSGGLTDEKVWQTPLALVSVRQSMNAIPGPAAEFRPPSKLACDLYYIRRISPSLNLRMMMEKALGMCCAPVGVTRAILRIPVSDVLDDAYRDHSGETDEMPVGVKPVPGEPGMNTTSASGCTWSHLVAHFPRVDMAPPHR